MKVTSQTRRWRFSSPHGTTDAPVEDVSCKTLSTGGLACTRKRRISSVVQARSPKVVNQTTTVATALNATRATPVPIHDGRATPVILVTVASSGRRRRPTAGYVTRLRYVAWQPGRH